MDVLTRWWESFHIGYIHQMYVPFKCFTVLFVNYTSMKLKKTPRNSCSCALGTDERDPYSWPGSLQRPFSTFWSSLGSSLFIYDTGHATSQTPRVFDIWYVLRKSPSKP